jgi:hypothetical protein
MACSLAMVIHCNLSFDMRYSNDSSSWAWPGLTPLLLSPVLVSTFCKGQKAIVWKCSLHTLINSSSVVARYGQQSWAHCSSVVDGCTLYAHPNLSSVIDRCPPWGLLPYREEVCMPQWPRELCWWEH